MSTTEKLGHIADRGSDIFDEVFDIVGIGASSTLGAWLLWFGLWAFILCFFSLTITLIGHSSCTVSAWDIDSGRRQFGDSEGAELTL
jgi:hypothetical protein